MMVNNLFEFYKKELTFYSQISKENSKTKLLIFLVGICFFIVLWYFFILLNAFIYGFLGMMMLLASLILILWLNGKTIKSKFPELYITAFKWDTIKLNNLFLEKLNKKIENISDESLNLIQDQIKENAKKAKTSSLIIMTTFGSLFIPLWSTYISEILSASNGNITQINNLFIIFFILTLIIFYVSFMIVKFYDDIITNFQKWERLNQLITELRILKGIK